MTPRDPEELNKEMHRLYDEAIEAYAEAFGTIEHYMERLDEFYGPIEIFGCIFTASNILRTMDTHTFHVGFEDHQSSIKVEAAREIELEYFQEQAIENLKRRRDNA